MRLTVVGSGTAAPHPTRVASGHLVETAGSCVLLDCGSGVVHRLAALGLPWHGITHIALTHFHYDHIGDLPALITAFRWGQMEPRRSPLTIIGPPGTAAWLGAWSGVVGAWLLDPDTYGITVAELEPAPNGAQVRAGDAVIESFRVPHTAESVAYSISSGRVRLVYTGDTPYDEPLADWAAACDVLLTECSLPAALDVPGHLTPESAGALAARVRPRQLVLTHFYPPVEREDIPSLVRARWGGALVLAHDGTVVDIEE